LLKQVCSTRTLHSIPPNITKENDARYKTITDLFTSISPDLSGINTWRYQRQISPGLQEYIEALSFHHYLQTQQIITFAEAMAKLPEGIMLTEDDYILGLFDLVGELMRFAITAMATSGEIPGSSRVTDGEGGIDMVRDMRALRVLFEGLDMQGSGVERDAEKKMDVMRQCVEKVENAVYGLIVRGKERPKGWIALDEGPGEGY
jgi:predicted translin family RNA/ssDNA-binding protein